MVKRKCIRCNIEKIVENNFSSTKKLCLDCQKIEPERRKKQKQKYPFDKEKHLKDRYNMTKTEYDSMLKSQKNKCAICKRTIFENGNKTFFVDHDHETNKVRGLLCHYCNSGLGFFKDDIRILKKAILYLKKF